MKILLNFLAVVLLVITIGTPIYFATNFAKVAGVKSQSKYLVISQVEKFPGMTLSQTEDKYQLSFTKHGPVQAFLGVLIVNNPTNQAQTYRLESTSEENYAFFGQNLQDQKAEIQVPPQSSAPVSINSTKEASEESQKVEFKIDTK